MRKVKVAATQMSCSWNREEVLDKAEKLVRKAAAEGANIILLQELFETPYFCQKQKFEYFDLAKPLSGNAAVKRFTEVAKELQVVLPISFYEKAGNTAFNTIAIIDADGTILGTYRMTHIPDGLPYAEKFYFTPGDTGFKVWKTKYADIGVGICWDQWFPEAARSMALLGAELLFYPTAIGSEPTLNVDSKSHWQHAMQGHAAANLLTVIAANLIGKEVVEPDTENGGQKSALTFYGSSFLSDETGELKKTASRDQEEILIGEYDLDELATKRLEWGLFRDRRPEMYRIIAGQK